MLKAYDYIEYSDNNAIVDGNIYFEKELKIAKNIAINYKGNGRIFEEKCPICASKNSKLFFYKWGIAYNRCDECASVFLSIDDELVSKYKNSSELIALRTSDVYQKEEAKNRDIMWEETIDWIRFRTFRYLRKKEVDIIDFGNRYEKFVEKIVNSPLCKSYQLKDSILKIEQYVNISMGNNDIALYLNNFQQSINPIKDLREVGKNLKKGGLLFFSSRIGTGFDILALRKNSKIFPFEHILLPSMSGLKQIIKEAGFKVLEESTPGNLDLAYVKKNKSKIDKNEYFIRQLADITDKSILQEFQRFLQKSGMSSYAQIVAQKEGD